MNLNAYTCTFRVLFVLLYARRRRENSRTNDVSEPNNGRMVLRNERTLLRRPRSLRFREREKFRV